MEKAVSYAVIGTISFIGAWVGTYIFNSPAKAEEANTATTNKITEVETKLSVLCNDYGQTVSRMDQNIQAIGQALKVPVVVGKPWSDPCKTK